MDALEGALSRVSVNEPTDEPTDGPADGPAAPAAVRRLRAFCEGKGIDTAGAIAFTIQRNRTGQYASLIVDFERGTLHDVYPRAFDQIYREGPVSESEEFLYCYHAGLDVTPLRGEAPRPFDEDETRTPYAFCCDALTPYRPRRTQNDRVFDGFLKGEGSAPGLMFEVKRQVDNGPLVSTAFFELRDGVRVRVEPEGPMSKTHSFKNYKCLCHNRFFGVDLCKAGSGGRNAHHLRCVAFAKRDAALEDAFFAHHEVA